MGEAPEVSDETLFAAWRAGDEQAFERLFRRWQEPLARHLARMLDDPAGAEDLVVETFLRLHQHRDRVRPGEPLKPLVWTIARNLARNRLRAERLWGWLPLTSADLEGPAARQADAEVPRRVAAAFAHLSRAQREACSLRLVGGLSLEEIAAVTGSSLGTVKSRLFYGLRRLRAELADLTPGKE
jgi:RNA polymerase sigma-70 factor, ECF subfamily